jgi:hypothetical protein
VGVPTRGSSSSTDFDLILCVTRIGYVQATLDTTVMNSDVVIKAFTYHVPTESDLDSKPNACRHGFRTAFKTSTGVIFEPRQFETPTVRSKILI